MSGILLKNHLYYVSYGNAKALLVNPVCPTLGLATIAGGTAAWKGAIRSRYSICSRASTTTGSFASV